MFFALQALIANLLAYHANWHAWLLLPLCFVSYLAGSLLYPRVQVRRWWRDAGEGPSWTGGPALPLRLLDILPPLVFVEVAFLLVAALAGTWATGSFVVGIATSAGAQVGLSRAIGREEQRRSQVLLIGLRRRLFLRLWTPDLWLRGHLEVSA
jgi:hypothetical protein